MEKTVSWDPQDEGAIGDHCAKGDLGYCCVFPSAPASAHCYY